MRRYLASIILALVSVTAAAWDNHAQLTAFALASESWASAVVTAESLDTFLAADKAGVSGVLATVEKNAARDYPMYKPLPAGLAFDPSREGDALRASFIGAIRVNPRYPFALFVQVPVGATDTRPAVDHAVVDPTSAHMANPPFRAIGEGEDVTAGEVVVSGSDEPDYGMDIGLFDNNGTDYGKTYGFGPQPFGNPNLSYGSQAPFHMSFVNEDSIIRKAAPKYQETFAGYRVDLYAALAREAFATGHAYWGWRFVGWALHYVEDAAQPYHASLLPSRTTLGILLLNAFGSKAQIDGEVVMVSNRHLLLENYQFGVMAAYAGDDAASPVYGALRPSGAAGVGDLGDASRPRWVLDVVAKRSHARGKALDAAIASTFPKKYVADPTFDYGAWQSDTHNAWDPRADLLSRDPAGAKAFEKALAPSLAEMGAAARAFTAAFAADATASSFARRGALALASP